MVYDLAMTHHRDGPHPAPGGSSGQFHNEVLGGLSWQAWAAPGVFVFLLSLPCLWFTYLWDDYAFLNNVLKLRLSDFLPDPSGTFYRPISRWLYFTILYAAREFGPFLGHLINIVALSLTASLVAGAGARLRGPRTGVLAGFLFAGLACAPTLVAWTSCSQDLLAILFVMFALHCQLSGRNTAALAFAAAALLSKETALAAIPVLVLVDWTVNPAAGRVRRHLVSYLLLVAAWVLVHPGIKTLLSRGMKLGATGYVGLQGPTEGLAQAGAYVLELANLRVGKFAPTWNTLEFLIVAVAVTVASVWLWRALGSLSPSVRARRPILILGSLLTVGPLILTSVMVRGSSQYYAAFPGIGSCLLLATWLDNRRRTVVASLVTLYFVLGLWSRASEMETSYLTESDFRISSGAHKKLQASLLRIQPAVLPGSQLLFSVQAHGKLRVYHQVYAYQMPRLWYRDPTLIVRKPEDRVEIDGPELLFAVSPDLDVIKIDPYTYAAVSANGRPIDYYVAEQALRTYAMGLAGVGKTDAGARLLVEMPEVDPSFEILHHRMAMMFLIAAGRGDDARRLAEGIPRTPKEWALGNLPAVLSQQPRRRSFDGAAMKAFGIDTTDVSALRELTEWFVSRGYFDVGGRFGDRILALAPGDRLGFRATSLRDSVETARALQRDDEALVP